MLARVEQAAPDGRRYAYSFSDALADALRSDFDALMWGELRTGDPRTVSYSQRTLASAGSRRRFMRIRLRTPYCASKISCGSPAPPTPGV
jgi:hypothetical protein